MNSKQSKSLLKNKDRKNLFIFLVFCLFLVFPATLSAQEKNITLSVKNENLQSIFDKVEKATDYYFTYKDVILPSEKNITISVKDKTVETFISDLLQPFNLTYKRNGNLFAITKQAKKQTKPIKGIVLDRDNTPAIGASVVLKNDPKIGTITDMDGFFNLSAEAGSTLLVSYLGHETKEVPIGDQNELNIRLEENSQLMEEVVVVGYRTVKKVSSIGSVGTIDMKRKENQPLTNTAQAMYSTPGLWVNQAGAKPGRDGLTIRIRGINSLNETGGAPLVLLDGVEYDINEIDPSGIESISILKDVSAAIYGSKAANGVVLITSKKGSKGKPRLEYKGSFGVQNPTYLPDVVTDPILYMKLRNQAEINIGVDPISVNYKASDIAEYEAGMKYDPSVYPASDWYDIALDPGYIQQHSLRLSGGTSAVTYTMGLGYTDQSGIFIANDDAKRYSYDLKLTAHVTDKLNVTGTVQGNLRQMNEVGYGSETIFQVITRGLPIFSDYHKGNVYGSTWLSTPGRNNIENPRMEVEQGFTYRDYQEFLATLALDYKLIDGLTYYATGSYRKIDHFSKDFMPTMYTVNPKTGDQKLFSTNAPRVKDWDTYGMQYSWSHRFVYEKIFDEKHDFHAMIGNDAQINKNRGFQAFNRGFIDNTLQELNALKDYTNAQTTGDSYEDRLVSLYGRLAYTYRDKYFIEGTMRYDASSRLSPGNRWAFFPSIMAGWRIDKENFFHAKEIDVLKLRASLGEMGSPSVARYAYLMTLASQMNYTFGGEPAAAQAITTLVDPDLTWERTRAYNVGADLSAFNNRLYFEGDLFYKRTYDILRRKSIPSQVGGLSGPNSNVGTVDNKGYEISLSWRDKIGNVSYGVNGSLSYVRNEVVDIKGDRLLSDGDRRITLEGYPINSFYLYEANGYYASMDEINQAQAVYGTRSALLPGYIKYVNQNGDNEINELDRIVVGNTLPEYTFSFGINLGYRNFTLESQFQGVGDVFVYPTGNLAFPFVNGAGLTKEYATDSWSQQNPNPHAKHPLLTIYDASGNNFIPSTQWLRNASYLRMKNIQLGYTIPNSITHKLKIDKIFVYVSGQNLWTLSGFKEGDPEMNTTRTNLYEYPNLKTISMGLNINF